MGWNPIKTVTDVAKVVTNPNEAKKVWDSAVDKAKSVDLKAAGHMALDVAGMVPVVGAAADVANAGWYAAEGDWTNAALSAAGAVPGIGDAATAAKLGKKAVTGAQALAKTNKAANAATTTTAAAKATPTSAAKTPTTAGTKTTPATVPAGTKTAPKPASATAGTKTAPKPATASGAKSQPSGASSKPAAGSSSKPAGSNETPSAAGGGKSGGNGPTDRTGTGGTSGGMDGCSDAAYQGTLHIRDEIRREGPNGNHSWATNLTDDQVADYLDSFVRSGNGQKLVDGSTGWYDAERGLIVIQKNEYSMTAYRESYENFLKKLL